MYDSDDETPFEWRTHRTHEQQEQRERMKQAVLERRQGPLREALKTCTDPREYAIRYEEVHAILKENAANALTSALEAIKPRVTDQEYAELTSALEAYIALVK